MTETPDRWKPIPGFEQRIEFHPAYDRRDEGLGIHGLEMRFVLVGPNGATQLVLYTNWMLPHIAKSDLYNEPLPADRGYHSPVPQYDGHGILVRECEYLGGRPCYYDGSSLAAAELFDVLVEQGDDGVWAELYNDYCGLFGEPAAPIPQPEVAP